MAFFGIWWAWMNFTWFASAHDADDVPYRLLTLVQITGVLIYAAAVPRMVEDHDRSRSSVIGYVIMRMALVTQWLRVARHFPDLRARCLRYAVGITLLQLLWVLILITPERYAPWLFLVLGHRRAVDPAVGRGSRSWQPLLATLPRRAHRGALRAVHDHRARRVDAVGNGRHPAGVDRRGVGQPDRRRRQRRC